MRRPRVEVLFVEDCVNYPAARALVERLMDELRIEPELRLIEIRAADEARELGFLGSPTIRVDGRDVEHGADRRRAFALACRVYRGTRGFAGQPDEAWVRAALEAAT